MKICVIKKTKQNVYIDENVDHGVTMRYKIILF
jgi:hypothetical protein